jgi:uncharacterized protein
MDYRPGKSMLSGMADFRSAIEAYIRANAKPVDKFSHQPRLYGLAVECASGQPFDDDVVFAGAWMHDLGVFVGHRPEDPEQLARWDHIAYAVRVVPGVLRDCGFPEAKIPAVLEVIKTHMPQHEPACFEAVLVRDADILEQLGSVGILRTVSKIGRDTRFARFEEALRVLRRNLEDLPGRLLLETARRLAQPRITVLRAFLEAAQTEAQGRGL